MKLVSVVKELDLKTHCGANLSDEVTGGYVGDLLSDVMAGATEDQIWITRQVHPNIIAVAALKELAAIVTVAEPEPETVVKAEAEGVALFSTDSSAFEVSGRLFKLLEP